MWQIVKNADDFDYLIDYPKGYEREKKYPVLIYLHGMGNVGKVVERLATVCPVRRERMNEDMPFMIVAPACNEHNWIIAFLKDCKNLYAILYTAIMPIKAEYICAAQVWADTQAGICL